MRKLAQNKVSESTLTFPLSLLYATAIWLLCGVIQEEWWVQIACMAVTTILMLQLNKLHVLIRIYSRMVSSTFLVLSCCACFLFPSIPGAIASMCIVMAYILLFTSYQDEKATGKVFYAFMVYGIASMAYVHILFLVPLLWLFMAKYLSLLSIRTWAASVIGLLTPYWIIGTWLIYHYGIDEWPEHFMPLATFHQPFDFGILSISQMATFTLMVILMLTGIVHFINKSYAENIRTRMFYSIFIWMDLTVAVFLFIQPQHYDLLMRMMLINTAPLIAHYFTLTSTKLTNASFFLFIVTVLMLTAYNLWNTSSLF
ncbi:MAG: hypothetical protein E7106_07690 [Prevotella sp.]|nr:hypothetical protein [Prevotella sp.]